MDRFLEKLTPPPPNDGSIHIHKEHWPLFIQVNTALTSSAMPIGQKNFEIRSFEPPSEGRSPRGASGFAHLLAGDQVSFPSR